MTAQTFLPGPAHNTVRTHAGQILPVPHGWELLTPGDAALTRREKGQRREVRRMLAQRSKELLGTYRRGELTGIACPLARALASCESAAGSEESTGLG